MRARIRAWAAAVRRAQLFSILAIVFVVIILPVTIGAIYAWNDRLSSADEEKWIAVKSDDMNAAVYNGMASNTFVCYVSKNATSMPAINQSVYFMSSTNLTYNSFFINTYTGLTSETEWYFAFNVNFSTQQWRDLNVEELRLYLWGANISVTYPSAANTKVGTSTASIRPVDSCMTVNNITIDGKVNNTTTPVLILKADVVQTLQWESQCGGVSKFNIWVKLSSAPANGTQFNFRIVAVGPSGAGVLHAWGGLDTMLAIYGLVLFGMAICATPYVNPTSPRKLHFGVRERYHNWRARRSYRHYRPWHRRHFGHRRWY